MMEEKSPGEKIKDLVSKIIQDHGLEKKEDEGIERWSHAESAEESEKIFHSLPGSIITTTIEKHIKKPMQKEEVISLLKEQLEVEKEVAKEIAKVLFVEIFPLAKKVPSEPQVVPETKKEEEKRAGEDPYLEMPE